MKHFVNRFPLYLMLVLALMLPSLSAAAEPAKLKVLLLPYLTFAPYFIAEEEGFFKEQDLDIEFVKAFTIQGSLPALIQGDLDVIAGFVSISTFNAIDQGAKVRFVADKGHAGGVADSCSPESIYINPQRHEQLAAGTFPSDEKYTVSIKKTTIEEYLFERVLPPEQMKIVNVKTPSELDALKSNSLDMAFVSEPWNSRLNEAQAGYQWKMVNDIYPGFQLASIIYGPNLLEKRPDLGVRFMTAYLKGVRRYNEGKTDKNIEIIQKYTKLTPELLKVACWPYIHNDLSINLKSTDDYGQWAKSKGYIEKLVPRDLYYDPQFVEQAVSALGQ